jgi:hypothetical protein
MCDGWELGGGLCLRFLDLLLHSSSSSSTTTPRLQPAALQALAGDIAAARNAAAARLAAAAAATDEDGGGRQDDASRSALRQLVALDGMARRVQAALLPLLAQQLAGAAGRTRRVGGGAVMLDVPGLWSACGGQQPVPPGMAVGCIATQLAHNLLAVSR